MFLIILKKIFHLCNFRLRLKFEKKSRFLYTATLVILGFILEGCHPRDVSSSEPNVIGIGEVAFDATKYQFQLFKLRNNQWVHVNKVDRSTKRIMIMLHGFEIGKRTPDFGISPNRLSYRLGLTDFSQCDRPIRTPPMQTTKQNEVYALAWNSVAGNPWELEQIMKDDIDLKKFASDPKYFQKPLGQDPFDAPHNQPLFKLLENFYGQISVDLEGQDINFAGFSKGGHMAIKLAQIHFKKYPARGKLKNLYLLDPYVGPAVLNGGLGQELIEIIDMIKQNVKIINIESSGVASLGDKEFYKHLRKEAGQFIVKRNARDQMALQNYKNLSRVKQAAELYLDHFRAPQYLLGSSLTCDSRLPTIDHPGSLATYTIENPDAISDWIYDGVIKEPQCPRQVQ